MTTDMLAVTGGTKIFYRGTQDERRALDGLDIALKPADFCIVIGSNGAGKSSFLNAVSGKLPLDSGRISIDGQDVTKLNAHRRAQFIARVFQDPMIGTAPTMTIGENMLLAELRGKRRGFSYGLTAARRARYSDQLAELNLGLEKRLDMRLDSSPAASASRCHSSWLYRRNQSSCCSTSIRQRSIPERQSLSWIQRSGPWKTWS